MSEQFFSKPKLISCGDVKKTFVSDDYKDAYEYALESLKKIYPSLLIPKRSSIALTTNWVFNDLSVGRIGFYINERKKTVVAKYRDKVAIVKCHEQDEWNVEIGLGLVISKLFNLKEHKAMREFFRDKKRKLDYKRYAKWVLLDFCYYNYNYEDFTKNKLIGKCPYTIKFNEKND